MYDTILYQREVLPDYDKDQLLGILLDQPWHWDCVILSGYPLSERDYRGRLSGVVIWYRPRKVFLRYSKGPDNKYFWDLYGDDFFTPERALLALSRAPAPLGYVGTTKEHT